MLSDGKIQLYPIKNIYAKAFPHGHFFVTYKDQAGQPNHADQMLREYSIPGDKLRPNLSIEAKNFIKIDNNGDSSRITYHMRFIDGKTMKKIQKKLSKEIVYSCHMMNGLKDKFNEVIGL